jgi:hypothetical protein
MVNLILVPFEFLFDPLLNDTGLADDLILLLQDVFHPLYRLVQLEDVGVELQQVLLVPVLLNDPHLPLKQELY